jgi:MraZ protein
MGESGENRTFVLKGSHATMPNEAEKPTPPESEKPAPKKVTKRSSSKASEKPPVKREVTMFLGEYDHNLDDKGRLAIPARFRDALEDGLIITRGFEKCLMGFPRAMWADVAAQVSSLSIGQSDARNLRRLLFSGAADVQLDRQGRVLIPQNLRDYAGLKEPVVIAGLSTHFEIWARDDWRDVLDSLDVSGGIIAEQLANLGL